MNYYKKKLFATRCRSLLIGLSILLTCCQSIPKSPHLTGLVIEQEPLTDAQVQLIDANGKQLQTTTDASGRYEFPLAGITAPLLLSAVSEGNAEDCTKNSILRPICMAAVIEKINPNQHQIGNINPLTDRIVSDLAVALGFIGPQQWVNSKKIGAFNPIQLHAAQNELRKGFKQALQLLDVKNSGSFNPATYSIQPDDKLIELFSLIHHNRNYDNNTGETGHTTLADISFRPIVGLLPQGAYEPFDLLRAQQELVQINNANRRIFIVGDSTSAVYEQLRFPRMGWGQAFEARFNQDSGIKVITGSRAGRSSRDFFNGRWFAQMEPLIRAGDYVFINHGHNDQNCDSSKPIRGAADVNNLCTYPNNSEGQPQFPNEQPELSFQHSLERYIKIARERGAIPVLFTPTTRIKNAQGQQTTPVVHSHVTKQNNKNGYLYTGDYTQTIKDTATANAVPLIDLEAASIQFVNGLAANEWKHYWLVVDPATNSFYANGAPGSIEAPDGTHFQKNGAEIIATLVAQEIKQNRELIDLGGGLK
ncbi:SGNH/GDSL hydrolase family protein [Cellvibrio fibrivorans]|uniref:Lysophospholipase L1-like esterase n=1 Tax=Cellvibrio fibrivorans TaxID=126350 RepID=A0ABU1UY72_9GAMM|nr:SGNH/GDSL hydrolase family protein [Cellvibrio fibrivorans]MDR7090111.1 lysophospholipase L1-like esterase [Cellvibrio fibrivorans]